MRKSLLALACILAPFSAKADTVSVFAAASLQTALDQIAQDFMAQTGHQVTISYGGSGALAKQILNGAPADLFLSAAPEWMDAVEKQGLVVDQTRKNLLGNELVVIAHGTGQPALDLGKPDDFRDRLADRPLSMASIDSVPAGTYGKAALDHLGLWASVQDHVVQSENVRSALNFVALGESQLGIVYATDAHASDAVSVVATFPETSHPPIQYPVALLVGATDAADADFLTYLSSEQAKSVFAAQGFKTEG